MSHVRPGYQGRGRTPCESFHRRVGFRPSSWCVCSLWSGAHVFYSIYFRKCMIRTRTADCYFAKKKTIFGRCILLVLQYCCTGACGRTCQTANNRESALDYSAGCTFGISSCYYGALSSCVFVIFLFLLSFPFSSAICPGLLRLVFWLGYMDRFSDPGRVHTYCLACHHLYPSSQQQYCWCITDACLCLSRF